MTDHEKRQLTRLIQDAKDGISVLETIIRRAALMLHPEPTSKTVNLLDKKTGKTHSPLVVVVPSSETVAFPVHSRQGSAGNSTDSGRDHLPR